VTVKKGTHTSLHLTVFAKQHTASLKTRSELTITRHPKGLPFLQNQFDYNDRSGASLEGLLRCSGTHVRLNIWPAAVHPSDYK
jgi:hypothetical protein